MKVESAIGLSFMERKKFAININLEQEIFGYKKSVKLLRRNNLFNIYHKKEYEILCLYFESQR